MPETYLPVVFLLMVNDTIIVNCCPEKKKQLENEGNDVRVMIESHNVRPDVHCGFKCIQTPPKR